MLKGIENLKPLTADDWPRVRDISIPFEPSADGPRFSMNASLQNAVCFTGSSQARRLVDAGDGETTVRILEMLKKAEQSLKNGVHRFRIEHDGLSFRAQVGRNAEHHDLQLRVLPTETPTLDDLQMPPAWRALMLEPSLCSGGLVLITGPNGQGKTTTASALIRSRLQAYGGMANTVEDPIELPLQGVWGNGVCYQRPVARGDKAELAGAGYHRALMDALRQFPAISGGCTQLFVGEIQDGLTAAETLKAAANGHLVVATVHGKSSISAVRRLLTLASDTDQGMAFNHVRDLFSECLRGVFNQRLMWSLEGSGWSSARIEGDLLWSGGFDSAVGRTLRSRDPEEVMEIAQRQTMELNSASGSAADIREAIARTTGMPSGGWVD